MAQAARKNQVRGDPSPTQDQGRTCRVLSGGRSSRHEQSQRCTAPQCLSGCHPRETARYYDINKDPGGTKSWGPSHEAPQPGAPPPGCHMARRHSRTAVQWPNPRQPQLRRNATSFEKLGLDARGCETTLRCPGRHAGISPETRTLVRAF